MFSKWTDRTRLEAMLLSLAVSMYLASRLNRAFRGDLRERNGIAEIRTEDWTVAWRFHIAHGRVRPVRGGHPNPDYAMVYKDISSAVKILSEGTDEAVMQGMADGTVRFDGDLAFGMWFNDLLKKLGSLVRERLESLPLKRSTK